MDRRAVRGVLMPLTETQLDEIRRRDSRAAVHTDDFGGEFVLAKDGRMHGQHAIMDRRRLLKHVDEVNQRLSAALSLAQSRSR